MPQVGLGDPADWLPSQHFMESRQGVMGPDPRSAPACAGQKILRRAGGQDVGHAPWTDTVTEARHPEWAQRLLTRLREGGPTHWRGPIPLGVHGAQRGCTPGYALWLEVVHWLAITPRGRVAWHLTARAPEPVASAMMGQTGKTARGFWPRCRGEPLASRGPDWCVPLFVERPVTTRGMALLFPSSGASPAGRFPRSWALPIAEASQPV
jgi:hypothetical protein